MKAGVIALAVLALLAGAAACFLKIESLSRDLKAEQGTHGICKSALALQNEAVKRMEIEGEARVARARDALARARADNRARRAKAPAGHGPAAMNAFVRSQFETGMEQTQ
jgi:hypothetical protein